MIIDHILSIMELVGKIGFPFMLIFLVIKENKRNTLILEQLKNICLMINDNVLAKDISELVKMMNQNMGSMLEMIRIIDERASQFLEIGNGAKKKGRDHK